MTGGACPGLPERVGISGSSAEPSALVMSHPAHELPIRGRVLRCREVVVRILVNMHSFESQPLEPLVLCEAMTHYPIGEIL